MEAMYLGASALFKQYWPPVTVGGLVLHEVLETIHTCVSSHHPHRDF